MQQPSSVDMLLIFPSFSPIFLHFPSFSLIFPHFFHLSHFSVAGWILGYSGYGYFPGLCEGRDRWCLFEMVDQFASASAMPIPGLCLLCHNLGILHQFF